MSSAADTIDRITPTRRPTEAAIGFQRWSDLLFVHWRMPAEVIASLLPPRLTIDTWGGDAWVGLVPFYMSGVRPWWSPPVPGISNFCETNLRTYVHLDGEQPGVWFFSLEAANSLAVRIARRNWNLPYFKAMMSLEKKGRNIHYHSARQWPEPIGAMTDIEIQIGEPIQSGTQTGAAAVGTLEHFLAERYLLYAADRGGNLYRGQVHHRPYQLRAARILSIEQTLLESANIHPPDKKFCHALYSEGVDVDIFRLRELSLAD